MFFFDTCNVVAAREDRKPKYWRLGRRHLGLSLTLWRHNVKLDNERGPGTATLTRHISRWRRREIQKWKIAFRKPRFVELQDQRFVTHLIYVQRTFWAQLVETAEVTVVTGKGNCANLFCAKSFSTRPSIPSRKYNLLITPVQETGIRMLFLYIPSNHNVEVVNADHFLTSSTKNFKRENRIYVDISWPYTAIN